MRSTEGVHTRLLVLRYSDCWEQFIVSGVRNLEFPGVRHLGTVPLDRLTRIPVHMYIHAYMYVSTVL